MTRNRVGITRAVEAYAANAKITPNRVWAAMRIYWEGVVFDWYEDSRWQVDPPENDRS